jgi:hypothetical protein
MENRVKDYKRDVKSRGTGHGSDSAMNGTGFLMDWMGEFWSC